MRLAIGPSGHPCPAVRAPVVGLHHWEVLNGNRKCVFGRYVHARVPQWSGKHAESIGNSILHISYAAEFFQLHLSSENHHF